MPPSARRWLIVAALFTVTYGVSMPLAAFGVFLPVLAETFAWSRGAIASALSINLLLGGLAGLGLGALADRRGPRAVLVVTVALAGAGFALVSTVQALWHLYLFVGVMGGVGMSSFYLLAASTVARWFDERRGLALALVLVGFNLGYISAGPLAARLIAATGWRTAYAVLGGGCGLIALVAASTVRLPRAAEAAALRRPPLGAGGVPLLAGASRPAPVGAGAGLTLAEALADPRQWCLNLSWFILGGLSLMLSVHAVPFAHDQGVGLAAASLALTAYGAGAVTGRLATGAVADRVGAMAAIGGGYALQALALLALLAVPSRGVLFAALAVFGAGFAASDTIVTKVVPEVFGVRALGAIMGVLALGWRCGAALAPAAAGFVHDATGSYTVPFGAAPIALLASWALFTIGTARRRHR